MSITRGSSRNLGPAYRAAPARRSSLRPATLSSSMRAGLVGSWRAHERIPPEGPVMQVTRGLLAGGIFFAIGASATFIASAYRMRTIVRMGPDFFPVATGCFLALIGPLLLCQEH